MNEVNREMFSDELVEAMENLHMYPRLIAERAAKEAVAAYRTALRAKVGGMCAACPECNIGKFDRMLGT